MEIINESVRCSAKRDKHPDRGPKKYGNRDHERAHRYARDKAYVRLSNLFPDVFDMVLDEERTKIGLAPIARYEPLEFSKIVSKTLDFNEVYDALESEGFDDA